MPSSKLRVGVLGAGAWAQHAHIPGWLRDPRCEIVAICDPRIELAQDFARQFRIPAATDDWQALLARHDIDVIDIVTPSQTRPQSFRTTLLPNSHKSVLSRRAFAWLSSSNAAFMR